MTSKVRVEWVQIASESANRGSLSDVIGVQLGAQTCSVVGQTVQSVSAPDEGPTGLAARITPISGAVVMTLDGSAPTETNGLRIGTDTGDALVAINAGAALQFVESAD